MTFNEAMDIFFKDEDESFVFDSSSLKSKYRFLAKKYHPDMISNSDNGKMFKEIAEAYTIIKENISIFDDNYEKLWNSYRGNVGPIYAQKNNSNDVPRGFNTSTYEVPDNLSKKISSILSSIFILKGYIYKRYINFDFPDDEYLIDCLIKFKFPDKYNLEIESRNLKSFMNSLIIELRKFYNRRFNVRLDISNYGVDEFKADLDTIWHELVEFENLRHNNRTKEDIVKDCIELVSKIKRIVDSKGGVIDKIRMFRLVYLLNSKEIDLNIILSEIYDFLRQYKLYDVSDDIYRNNIQVIKRFTSSDLPEMSKMINEWQNHIYKNELMNKK